MKPASAGDKNFKTSGKSSITRPGRFFGSKEEGSVQPVDTGRRSARSAGKSRPEDLGYSSLSCAHTMETRERPATETRVTITPACRNMDPNETRTSR